MSTAFDLIQGFMASIISLHMPGVPWLTVGGFIIALWFLAFAGVAFKAIMYGDLTSK